MDGKMNDKLTILTGDCRETLKTLPDASVQCCVTSPPYFGLRDYGTAKWEGGEESCAHLAPRLGGNGEKSPINGGRGQQSERDNAVQLQQYKNECKKCGARRVDNQLGLEPTPDAYVANMVAVFREVKRVLRDDGTLWLNLGDSFFSNTKGSGGASAKQDSNAGSRFNAGSLPLKPKDLIGIPWRVAFALQADGWYLRQDIIWHKPNPMPESVTDRCTKAHEYLFLMSKSARYYFDAAAINEPMAEVSKARMGRGVSAEHKNVNGAPGQTPHSMNAPRLHGEIVDVPETRNRRSVWTVATSPYKGAHFATFPQDLVKPCILAGCPVGGTVLDPFGGSGTTGLVANMLGRKAVLCELNPKYVELMHERRNDTAPLLLNTEAA